jgi:hypothetical protein
MTSISTNIFSIFGETYAGHKAVSLGITIHARDEIGSSYIVSSQDAHLTLEEAEEIVRDLQSAIFIAKNAMARQDAEVREQLAVINAN